MKKETWKQILHIIITILTAIVTALTTTSCIGKGPF
ncbi:MAG: smalltalk protein [Bacteroidaceae bacterium]|nr:smalltalk protein [Bacteroidaceae bacterium]